MQGYSLNGYLNAIIRRSDKTLLLEGISDRTLLNRLKLERLPTSAPKGQFDCVQIISDPALAGLGNKARIFAIRDAIASKPSPLRKKIEAKFGTLVDREWEGIDVGIGIPAEWNPPIQTDGSFTTLGHSIENYFFSSTGAVAYLRQSFPNEISVQFLQNIEERFHQIVALAAAYSLKLRSRNGLSRADGAISHKLVAWKNNRYLLDQRLNDVLIARGLQLPADFCDSVNADVDTYLGQFQTIEPGRWLCHGHLGEQAIWSCIGSLAQEHGISEETARAIERGSRDIKLKHAADYLCRVAVQDRKPLDEAIDWLQA